MKNFRLTIGEGEPIEAKEVKLPTIGPDPKLRIYDDVGYYTPAWKNLIAAPNNMAIGRVAEPINPNDPRMNRAARRRALKKDQKP